MAKIDLSKLDTKTLRAIVKSESLEDFLNYVKKNEVDLSDEYAAEVYHLLSSDIQELSDDQLAMVSGGFGSPGMGKS